MKNGKTRIAAIRAAEILDSRGNPTVETTVILEDGTEAVASVPSGASTGKYEATEKRDGDAVRYGGRGVLSAVEGVNTAIAPALLGIDAEEQARIDSIMIALDGTYNKSNLGANAILSVSLAVARAAAGAQGVPLYRYFGGVHSDTLPVPMMNVLNGGMHADNNVDIQEMMLVPVGVPSFAEALRAGTEITHALRALLRTQGYATAVGDEGGFSPDLASDEEALQLLLSAITGAGYRPGEDIMLALDVAASGFAGADGYRFPKRGVHRTADEMVTYYTHLLDAYPILSIEDGMGEDDTAGWQSLTEGAGKRALLVGDDLFVTNRDRLAKGIREHLANAILIKPNQIGTLTETAETITLARRAGYRVILSHRSGETTDTALADLAVGFGADFIKSGAPVRGERVCKYNRLLAIERELFHPGFGTASV